MKTWLIALSLAVATSAALAPLQAEAKRLGGGKSAGMQRQMPAKPAEGPNATPAQPGQPVQPANAAAPGAAGAAAAAPGKRSWLGPVAGIAAGLGIAALMSHFGMSEGFGNLLTMLLLAGVVFLGVRWLLARMGGGRPNAEPQLAGAGARYGSAQTPLRDAAPSLPLQRTAPEFAPLQALPPAAVATTASTAAASARPEGFDAAAFERIAKMIFIRLQAANDAGSVADLRKFTTPELFASLRVDLQDRHGAAQQTDVLQIDANVLDTAQEDGQWVVTVRFHGLVREQSESAAEPFDELWHLVRPLDGSRDWAIAGITQTA